MIPKSQSQSAREKRKINFFTCCKACVTYATFGYGHRHNREALRWHIRRATQVNDLGRVYDHLVTSGYAFLAGLPAMATALKQRQITVRPWSRRDRKALAAWPPATIVAAWANTGTAWGRRESHAILLEGLLIGRITLRDVQPGAEARLGIYLHPDYVGRGYGSTALAHFLATFFESFYCLKLDVAVGNDRALRCYRRLGFEAGHYEARGTDNPVLFVHMHLTRGRWEQINASG